MGILDIHGYTSDDQWIIYPFGTLPKEYKETTTYKRLAAGDMDTLSGAVAYWLIVDSLDRTIERVNAPGHR